MNKIPAKPYVLSRQSGARVGWQLNLPETLQLAINEGGTNKTCQIASGYLT